MIKAESVLENAKKLDPGLMELVSGPLTGQISQASTPEMAQKGSLCFVSDENQLQMALKNGASVLIASPKVKEAAKLAIGDRTLFVAKSIPSAMAAVLPLFDPKLSSFASGIDPKAVIHPSAKIGKNTVIGAGAVICANAQIGDNCIIHPLVVVGERSVVGNFCELHSHVVIGSDGFGFAPDKDKRFHKIPQLGIVVLEDHVELGAHCAIDRATLGETRIGEGTKFDNHCHVAHNCQIGKHNAFAAGLMIAGSTTVGSHCMSGGGAVIADHLTICDGVSIGGKSGVTKDITKPGVYTGYPLEPIADAMKTLVNITHLTSLRKQMAQVRKHLGLKDE